MRTKQTVESNLRPSGFDFISPFYKKNHSSDSLIGEIDSLLGTKDFSAKCIPFYSDRHPTELFPKSSTKSRKVVIQKKGDGVHLFKLTYYYREGSEEKEEAGIFFIYEHPEYTKVYVAITIESSNFFRRGLKPFIEGLFPHTMMTFITHQRLKKILEKFQVENQFLDLIITRASQRFRFNSNGKERKIVPSVSWPKMNLIEAFDWIYQNNGWFQSLQFKATGPTSSIGEVSITRQGIIKTTHQFSKVFEGFVHPVCKVIYENSEFFGNRSRVNNTKLSARPLTIDFESEQFQDVSENEKFIAALKYLKKASVSVLHGNPYIHLSVIDYFDGSTFDLWVLNSNQLVIVPQMKASIFSIKRLINHIFDKYAEGAIREYERTAN